VVLARGFLEGVEDEELADLLGTTRANVHVIRCRDLAKLREDESFLAQLSELYDG
jgi:transcriptional regulator